MFNIKKFNLISIGTVVFYAMIISLPALLGYTTFVEETCPLYLEQRLTQATIISFNNIENEKTTGKEKTKLNSSKIVETDDEAGIKLTAGAVALSNLLFHEGNCIS